jgi:hypothetical protein
LSRATKGGAGRNGSRSGCGGGVGSGGNSKGGGVVAQRVRKALQPGLMALVGALGPREIAQVASLLPGGTQGAPRALLKQLMEEHRRHHRYSGSGGGGPP